MTVLIDGIKYVPAAQASGRIGVGVTTRNRPEMLAKAMAAWDKYLPAGAKLVVVDDASDNPVEGATYRFSTNVGVARAKNKCLELLDDCQHIFLFDDDAWPRRADWYVPYIASPEPHLMYIFKDLATSHKLRDIDVIYQDEQHVAYSGPRGVMLYVDHSVIDKVGGMDTVYGKWGYEHGDWSNRIHHAGLTSWRYADVVGSSELIYSADEYEAVKRSVPTAERLKLSQRNAEIHNRRRLERYRAYCEYRETNNVVLTCLYGSNSDPQRPGHQMKLADTSKLVSSVKGAKTVIYTDLPTTNLQPTDTVTYVADELHGENIYFKRWLNVYQYLREHKEIQWVAAVDATDVVMQLEPWNELKPGKLYCGYEPKVLADSWLRSNHPDPIVQQFIDDHPNRQMLNAGVVMGDRATVMQLAHNMVMHYFDRKLFKAMGKDKTGSDLGDMGAFNVEASQLNPVWGSKVTTMFKQNEVNSFSYWRHK